MPQQVDHDARRRQLAEIAANLIAQGGAEAATVRAVAQAAGYSTKVVSHYFADKRALMLHTYRHAAIRSGELTQASQPVGGADVAALMEALLPVDAEVQRNWRVWFAFWGLAFADAEMAEEQRDRAREFEARISEDLRADPLFADLGNSERTLLASRLFSTLVGIAMQAVFDPESWPPERQKEIIRGTLAAPRLKRQKIWR
jgi:AcrR family transcriptional regulator